MDIRLLTIGRHFKVSPGVRIVLGRDSRENDILAEIASPGYNLLQPHDFMGPAAILTGTPTETAKELAGRLIVTYSKKLSGSQRKIRFGDDIFVAGDPVPSPGSFLMRIGTN